MSRGTTIIEMSATARVRVRARVAWGATVRVRWFVARWSSVARTAVDGVVRGVAEQQRRLAHRAHLVAWVYGRYRIATDIAIGLLYRWSAPPRRRRPSSRGLGRRRAPAGGCGGRGRRACDTQTVWRALSRKSKRSVRPTEGRVGVRCVGMVWECTVRVALCGRACSRWPV